MFAPELHLRLREASVGRMKFLRLLVSLFVALFVGGALAEEAKPVTDLEAVVPRAIQLLEAKEYKVLLQIFISPAEFEMVEKEGGLDELAKKWGSSKKPERLLAVLKAVKGTKPEMSEDGRKATYGLADAVEGKSSISFVKIGEAWYLVN